MKISKYQYGNPIEEWGSQWKDRLQPSARSKVLQKWNASGKKPKPESSNEYTKRRVKEETKRTWRSDAADILHGIGEGVLALHPYTAIPYYGAKVGQDVLNGNVNWETALNASIPLFHLSPQAVGLREATNVALEDAANAGSKTARNWRVAREINQATKSKPNISNRTISVKRSNNEITGQPDLVYTLYNEFGEPIGQTNIGGAVFGSGNKTHRMVDGVMSMRNAHKVSEDTYNAAVQDIIDNGGKGLESGWSLMMPQKTLAVTSKFPHTVIGQEFGNPVRLLTGTSKRSIPQKVQGNHYLEQKPSFEIKYNESTGNFEQVPITNQEPYVSTSLKFFERKPSKNNIVGASQDYSMEDSKGMDFIKQFFAQQKINGKEYTLEGLKDAKNVQQGLPEYIQSYLNQNTVERAVKAMRKNGYSEREIQQYVDKVNEVMNKVKVGMYSDQEYNAAGAQDFGGFYNNDQNFISVNKDAYLSKPNFTPNYILKHEGRHLIDYNTSMTNDVINTLEKAYDKDFLEIPKHEDAGSLKNYQHMDRERVTTNRDAREVLLSDLEKHPGEFQNQTKFAQTSSGKYKDMVDFQNELIQYADPEDIINAVENSNGYGKRYINYLKKNNKLTSTKIEQLRQAMIHVPSYLLPVAGGYTLYNLFNQPQQQLPIEKQGGKMNILEFLKNGSGIHIKKKNRGKFTDYCGGQVTQECINKGKHSSNPAIRKRATFADNARHFKHKDGGKAFINGVSILDSNPNAYKYVKKKYKMAQEGTKLNFWQKTGNFLNSGLGQTLVNGITGVIKTTAENKNVDAQAKAAQAQNEADWAQMMNQIIKQNQEENNRNYMQWVSAYQNGLIQDQSSQIVAAHIGQEKLNQDLAAGKQNLKNKNSQISSAAQAAKSENWANTFGNIVQQGMGTIGQLIGNNTNSGTTKSKINFGTSDYKLQLPEMWNNPTLFNK